MNEPCDSRDEIAPPDLASMQSLPWRQVLEAARTAAASQEPVLIVGESGTGKTQVARLIHHLGPRRGKRSREWQFLAEEWGDPRMVAFGTVEGARDPSKGWRGDFPTCTGGTLLVDHADSLPAEQQGVIEEFLRHSVVFPIGASEPYAVDLRLILVAGVGHLPINPKHSALLPSLWDRLRSNVISVPPLRERPEDVRTLLEYEIGRLPEHLGLHGDWEPPVLTEEAISFVEKRRLPANGWTLRRLAMNLWFRTRKDVITLPALRELLTEEDFDLDGFRPLEVGPSKRARELTAGRRQGGRRPLTPRSRM
jgi:DNA-binding NtrC family response regulator